MRIGTLIAIYFLIWWITLFAVLPWGVRNQEESGEVRPAPIPGAPAIHRVWSKLLWTTLVASVVFAILYAIYARGLIPIDWLTKISAPPRCSDMSGQQKKSRARLPCSSHVIVLDPRLLFVCDRGGGGLSRQGLASLPRLGPHGWSRSCTPEPPFTRIAAR